MAEGNGVLHKNVADLTRASVQGATTSTTEGDGFSNMLLLVRSGEYVSPWWSKQRDADLKKFVKGVDYLSSAFFKTVVKMTEMSPRVEPRETTLKRYIKDADRWNQKLYETSEFGEGWAKLLSKGLWDIFSQDNGLFWEVIAPGRKDRPITGTALGLASLDPERCTRTANPQWPVIYRDPDSNKRYRLHYTRVIALSQIPSSERRMNNVGLCWASRTINVAQHLLDLLIYEQEKMGSRPMRQLIIGQGIGPEQIWDAFMQAEEQMDQQGLRRYAKNVVMGSTTNTDIDVKTVPLTNVPDGFNKETSINYAMFAIALAGGIPPRDLWPATTVGATKADALFQHLGGAAGYKYMLDQIGFGLGGDNKSTRHSAGKFLPAHLKLTFSVVDDDQDERQATVKELRSKVWNTHLQEGVLTVRVVREQMLTAGDLTRSQFETLELEDGRLSDGSDVLTLYFSDDPMTQQLLDIGVDNPTNIDAHEGESEQIISSIDEKIIEAQVIHAQTGNAQVHRTTEEVLGALQKLRDNYEDPERELTDEPEQISRPTDEELAENDDESAFSEAPAGA